MTTKKPKKKKAKAKLPKKDGRPTVYNEKMATKILELASRGAVDTEIAKKLGICLATLSAWKVKYPDFLDALRRAKAAADDFVVSALFQRARGYSHPAMKFFNDEGHVISQEYTEHYPPDTTAAIFWLKNRQSKEWRDAHKLEHGGEISMPHVTLTLPPNGRTKEENE